MFVAVADIPNNSDSTSSGAATNTTINGAIGGVVLLIAIIILILAMILCIRKLRKKQAYSVNLEAYNDIYHSK